jgi:hypothetical protein
MAKAPISRFSVPDPDELPADMRERIQAVSEKGRLRAQRLPGACAPARRISRFLRLL